MIHRTNTEPAETPGRPIELLPGMICAGSRNGISGTADRVPPVYRSGAMDHLDLPSRIGRRLVYRDGTTREAA